MTDSPHNTAPGPSTAATLPSADSGLAALTLLARFHNVPADQAQLAHRYGGSGLVQISDLLLAARGLQLKARLVETNVMRLPKTPLPAMALDRTGQWFILGRVEGDKALVQDPISGEPAILSTAQLSERWSGKLILIASRASLLGEMARFDFSWFVPAIIKYRRLLLEVLGVSIVLQLFALITPLFFQVVMDKVLVHRGFTTLDVIASGLLIVTLFEISLSALRNYVFSHTTNRIDVELGARLFRHLLALPLAYFEARRVGDSVARVRELENIRSFLTGPAMTSVLDLMFSGIFLLVMFYYSGWLTLIVVISLPVYIAISAGVSPMLRRRLDEKFARGADNHAFLVEAVNGAGTVKSLAVEPLFTHRWDQQLSAYVSADFRVTVLANLGQHAVQLVHKLVTVATLWFGARFVIAGELSVGQLIAFNMLAGQVAAPVIRLAQLWQDFQQTGISMQRLGDILNTRTEITQSRQTLPGIRGRVDFEHLSFRYKPDGNEVLTDINLTIEAGEMIGIVGRSGSGKSTLTKLLQRLYHPQRGRVLVDGHDLALADPAWLRRQIGVVLQDNLLFNMSIRENIALTEPSCALERVIQAAQLAGAHEFIIELPEGYDTRLAEHGGSLSGGQQQRVAIARALLSEPRLLIFDEATSALDYESERAIQQNMEAISRGRTVIIIAHRLSAVRKANRIVVMERGQIVEVGNHDTLAQRENGIYARLLSLQNS